MGQWHLHFIARVADKQVNVGSDLVKVKYSNVTEISITINSKKYIQVKSDEKYLLDFFIAINNSFWEPVVTIIPSRHLR